MTALRIHSTMTDDSVYFISEDYKKLAQIADDFRSTSDYETFFNNNCSREDIICFDDCINCVDIYTSETADSKIINNTADGALYMVEAITTIHDRF